MEKQFKKTLASIQTRSNRSHSDTVREFFNCVSYTMIMNSLFQLERRELFYSGSNIYGFNQLAIQSGFIEKSIMLTDRHKFSIEEKFYNQFDTEIIDTANLISLEIQKQPLTDVFNNIFEPRQPGGCKLKTAPVRPVVAARPAEYVCSEDLFY